MAQRSYLQKQLAPSKLIFYTLFHGLHLILFVIGWYSQAANHRLATLNKLTFSVWMSRGAGLVLSVDVTIILLPMCRKLMSWMRPKMKWLPLDETQYFHRQCAYSLLFWTVVHTLSHYVNFFNIEHNQIRPEAAVQILYTQAGPITGHVMLLCMVLIYTTSHQEVRRQSFETFWYTHHLFVPFLLAMYTHATGCFVRDSIPPYSPFAGQLFWDHCIGYEGWRWELASFALYLGERIYREITSRRKTSIVKVIKHPYDAVEIQFRKPSMRYKAGQWLFLNIPSISPHQWHPFTITSCPQDDYISIHIRQVGDFTRALASAVGAGPQQAELYDSLDPSGIYEISLAQGDEMPQIRVDGPYGAPAEDVFDNEIAILIGTGIGVTPWAAILKSIWNQRAGPNPPRRLRRVEFIWVCKDTTSFEWFQALLSSLEAQSLAEAASVNPTKPGMYGSGGEFLRIHTYLTQKLNIDMANNIVLNSVGMDRDPLTALNSRTNFGRPDFDKLLKAMTEGILNQSYVAQPAASSRKRTDVGVYFCGPNAVAREIKSACTRATVPEVRFKFWKEHF